MRTPSLLLLAVLGFATTACAQQDPLPGSVTAHLPKNAALVIRFRSMERVDAEAMARLGRAHNVGLTFNLGALKPLAMLLGMTAPEAGTMLAQLPDELRLSSAFTFADGDIHWRGDWPLEAIADAARRLQAPAKAPGPRKEDEFK